MKKIFFLTFLLIASYGSSASAQRAFCLLSEESKKNLYVAYKWPDGSVTSGNDAGTVAVLVTGFYELVSFDNVKGVCEVPEKYLPYVPEDQRPDQPATEKCKKYQDLFDPPATGCKFTIRLGVQCINGEGKVVNSGYHVKDSQGREAYAQEPVKGHEDDACEPIYGGDGWENVDLGKEDATLPGSGNDKPIPEGCKKLVCIDSGECATVNNCDESGKPKTDGEGNEHSDDWYQKCVYKDANGYIKIKDECLSSGDGSGDGDGDGDGDGSGNGNGNGSGSGDYGGKLDSIIGKLDEISKKISGSGNGSGTGEGKGFDGNFGSDGDLDGAVNNGGWGDGQGDYSLKRGTDEHKKYLDDLAEKGPIKQIKEHGYIKTSGAYCSVSINLFNRSFILSLCEYEPQLRLFGNILLGIAGLSGMLLILRR